MHMLVTASTQLCERLGKETLDYGYCIDYAFKVGPPPLRRFGRIMRKLVNLFLNVTQFGFCCVYFVFMASNLKMVVDYNVFGVVVNDPRFFVIIESQGAFLVKDDRVLKGPLGCSLHSFARTAHSAHSLRSALLARSVHGLAHSLRSLPRGTVKILEYVFML